MTRSATADAARACVEARRGRILAGLARPVLAVGHDAELLPPERLAYLRREAEDLYWNELAWEQLTDEEAIAGGHLTEMVFPGFLAFVEGLLLDHEPHEAPAPARPHPDAVEEILAFLGERHAAFRAELEQGIDSQKVVWARAMTGHLIDLVLYRLYGLSPAERERLEEAA